MQSKEEFTKEHRAAFEEDLKKVIDDSFWDAFEEDKQIVDKLKGACYAIYSLGFHRGHNMLGRTIMSGLQKAKEAASGQTPG